MKLANQIPNRIEQGPRPNFTVRRLGAGALVALGVGSAVVFGRAFAETNKTPEFSEQTHQIVADIGDSVWQMADTIEGANNFDKQVLVDGIESRNPSLNDGLQIGEAVEVPDSVR